MAVVLKCKMCGGDLSYSGNDRICICEFCGTSQAIPSTDDEKRITLFNRANALRMRAEYDQAFRIYDAIVAEFPEEADAYWGQCLCRYGIEYVEDPVSRERKPTCHRTVITSILKDDSFLSACEKTDTAGRIYYQQEAEIIDRIQQEILRIAEREAPYDVFICYKETTESGDRTEDSVLAQSIYDDLTERGLRAFFARVSLENRLGEQYEPIIYAALKSARVMLAVGTQYEYFESPWVRNEWSRFLRMRKEDGKKALIPCYKGIDAYDMPKEFSGFQAQDMGKLGWMQDLARGVLKLCGKGASGAETSRETAAVVSVRNLQIRAEQFLEDKEWDKAVQYADRILEQEPENSDAFLIRLLADCRVVKTEDLLKTDGAFGQNQNYLRLMKIGNEKLCSQLKEYHEAARKKTDYALAKGKLESLQRRMIQASTQAEFAEIRADLEKIRDFGKQVDLEIQACEQKIKALDQIDILRGDQQKKKEAYLTAKKAVREAEGNLALAQYRLDEAEQQRTMRKGLLGSVLSGHQNASAKGKLEEKAAGCQETLQSAVNNLPSLDEQREIGYQIAEICDRNGFEWAACEEEASLGEYKGSELKSNALFQVGKTVRFGHFVQDNGGSCTAPIEWIVIGIGSRHVVLLSKYGIRRAIYCAADKKATWENSPLRKWLNGSFLQSAFNREEQRRILTSHIDNSLQHGAKNISRDGGKDTDDKIFLLSVKELIDYKVPLACGFCSTEWAKREGIPINQETGNCNWWLRSPGSTDEKNTYISYSLKLSEATAATANGICLRPALMLDVGNLMDMKAQALRDSYDNLSFIRNEENEKVKKTLARRLGFLYYGKKGGLLRSYLAFGSAETTEGMAQLMRQYEGLAKAKALLQATYKHLSVPYVFRPGQPFACPSAYVGWGMYPQDEGGCKQLIQWFFMDRKGDEVLLVSRYAIDMAPFHHSDGPVSWAESSLRKWLNTEFWEEAFTPEEQQAIRWHPIRKDMQSSRPGAGEEPPEIVSMDHVFLLSGSEYDRYYNAGGYMNCSATPYAAQKYNACGNGKLEEKDSVCWWLRSTDMEGLKVDYIISLKEGERSVTGPEKGPSRPDFLKQKAVNPCFFVRPAIIMDLKVLRMILNISGNQA